MFQPQPTPYSPFSSYGVVPDFHSFQASHTGRSALVADSGGPTIIRNPIFTPVNANNPVALNYNSSSLAPQFKMATNGIVHDLEQQEELARNFQPELQVGRSVGEVRCDQKLMAMQGPLVGEKRSSHAITEEYAKADPIYVAKTAVSASAEVV
jgi:ubiquitin thioesterase protein OTUB1